MNPGSGNDTRPEWARKRPDYPRTEIAGTLVGVMRLKLLDRGMKLIPHWTRAIRRFDVHELILTDTPAQPGDDVRRCAYLGFAEFDNGGVAMHGDEVTIGGTVVGTIAGFDETHMPNHQNIVVSGAALLTGIERDLRLHAPLVFRPVFTGDDAHRASDLQPS